MQIRTRAIRGVTVVAPVGGLDPAGSRELQTAISGIVDRGERWVVIDLTRIDHTTGTSIGVLLAVRRKIEGHMGGVVLCGMSENVKRAFDLIGITGRFRIVKSTLSAIRILLKEKQIKELADHVASLLIASEERHAQKEMSG